MRPSSTLGRALQQVQVDTHRQMERRAREAMYYEIAEREQQFQFPISGTVGLVPSESLVKIRFDILFVYEYGYRRDSQLLEPLVRFGFSQLSAPPGTVPYAHVQSWAQDHDLNYVGANVLVGMHNPSIAVMGTDQISSTDFKGTLHCSFQGYGVPIDTYVDES